MRSPFLAFLVGINNINFLVLMIIGGNQEQLELYIPAPVISNFLMIRYFSTNLKLFEKKVV
jgi:hypothetical protein